MHVYNITSGFLIVKTFARMCREYLASLAHGWPHLLGRRGYSVPRRSVPPEQMPRQYRGLHREPIQGWVEALRGSGVVEPTDQELEASLALTQLDREGKSDNDFVHELTDAKKLMEMIDPPVEREIIWARIVDEGYPPPAEISQDDPILRKTELLGYDPSAFYPPYCSSAIAESMFFTWWLCDDEETLRFAAHHEKLNKWGLFRTSADAAQFLEVYLHALAPDADEREYGHRIVEVRALP